MNITIRNKRLIQRILIAFILSLIVSLPVSFSRVYAHSYSVAFTRVDNTGGETTIQYSVDDLSVIESIEGMDLNGDYYLDAGELNINKDLVLAWIDKRLDIVINGSKLNLLQGELALNKELPDKNNFQLQNDATYEDYVLSDAKIVTFTVVLPKIQASDSLIITDHFHDTILSEYVNFVNVLKNGEIISTTALFQNPWSVIVQDGTQNTNHSTSSGIDWSKFLLLGSEHILTGIDHLLFLLTLIVLRMRAKDYVRIITSFTVAHSLTLALSVLGIVTLPSRFVESMIAASIVYVALENLFFPGNAKNRWWLTFLFGLIHGLGFADLLTGMHLPKSQLVQSLLSFNLGIELTQLGLLAIASPLLWIWYKSHLYRRSFQVINIFAAIIAAVWLFQRITG